LYAFLYGLADRPIFDLHINHYSTKLFRVIIERGLGQYDFYVAMPHFTVYTQPEEYLSVLHMISPHELVLLDKDLPNLQYKCLVVYQDFARDIEKSLNSAANDLLKYPRMRMILPGDDKFPLEINLGFRHVCA
jgi:hypothetical protein